MEVKFRKVVLQQEHKKQPQKAASEKDSKHPLFSFFLLLICESRKELDLDFNVDLSN